MILQLIMPRPTNEVIIGVKAFLSGYFFSCEDIKFISSDTDKDVWFVFIFVKSEKYSFKEFSAAYKTIEPELKSICTMQEIVHLTGSMSSRFWNSEQRQLLKDTITAYYKWQKGETVEGISEQIKKEIEEGNGEKV